MRDEYKHPSGHMVRDRQKRMAHAQRMAVARIAVEPPPSRGITLPTLHFMRKDAPYACTDKI